MTLTLEVRLKAALEFFGPQTAQELQDKLYLVQENVSVREIERALATLVRLGMARRSDVKGYYVAV